MPEISVDSSLAPELVEFWGTKYKEVKEELEELKRTVSIKHEPEQDDDHANLADLVRQLQDESSKREASDKMFRETITAARNNESAMGERLAAAEKEKSDCLVRLTAAEADRATLAQQVQVFYTQAVALASEADRHRREAIAQLFPPVSFVEEYFEAKALLFTDVQALIRGLPVTLTQTSRLYFLPRPPSCMPLRVTSCGKPGYWFYPSWVLPEGTEFELIVEGRAGEWGYLGKYSSAPFPGYEMKLSEWMTLDEQTKLAHCARVASQSLAPGQVASYPAQLDAKRRYETGEWNVPCYTLRCVGFNMQLYHALHIAASNAHIASTSPELLPPSSSASSVRAASSVEGPEQDGEAGVSGKRRRGA